MYIDKDFVDYATERRRQPAPQRSSPTLVLTLIMCAIGLVLAFLG